MAINSKVAVLYFSLLFFVLILALFPNIDKKMANSITGRASESEMQTQVYIVNFSSAVCNATIISGWNLFSVPCISREMSFDVLNSLYGSYYSLHAYNPTDTADPWKSYNPELPNWTVQDLAVIDRKKGYWINMRENDTLYHDGELITPNVINVYQGWNLVGYPKMMAYFSNESFVSLYPNFVIVYAYNSTLSQWKFYRYSYSSNTLNHTVPYYGYWINMSANDQWEIAW